MHFEERYGYNLSCKIWLILNKSFEEFCSYCDKKLCLRNTIYNAKTCVRDSKRKRCYDKLKKTKEKFVKKLTNFQKDEFADSVWQRDAGFIPDKKQIDHWEKYCRFWRCLTSQERVQFYKIHKDNLYLCNNLDVAHVEGKGRNPGEKTNLENVVLLNRLAHSLLDTYFDPLTKEKITAEERERWFDRIISYSN